MNKVKLKKCSVCEAEFKPFRSTEKVCSIPCAIKFVKIKKAHHESRELNKRKKELRENDRPKQLRLTQKAFNKLRKLQEYKWFSDRGLEPTCISCGAEKGLDHWACGHFKTTGKTSLRYDPLNTFLQHNVRCNKNLSGDIEGSNTTHGYKQGLINRFGKEKGESIIDYCESHHPDPNYTCEKLISMRKQFNIEIRKLEQENEIV